MGQVSDCIGWTEYVLRWEFEVDLIFIKKQTTYTGHERLRGARRYGAQALVKT